MEPWERKRRLTQTDRLHLASKWTPPEAYGVHDHPVAIAQDGLVSFNRFVCTGDTRFLERAQAAADLLLDLQRSDGSWRYSFDFIDLGVGWSSAMAQGQAASLLLRVYQAVGVFAYLDAAQRAIDYTLLPISDGGTLGAFADGTPMLEEYPSSEASPQTLNGSIFALWGLRDCALVSGDERYRRDFDRLASGIAEHLPLFDTGEWSRYSLRADGLHLTDEQYHRVHIAQTRAMYEITEDQRWRLAATTWAGYYSNRVSRNFFVILWRDTSARANVIRQRRAAHKS